MYRNEHLIGEVLKEWLLSGKITRKDLFVTTKLPPMCVDAECVEEYMIKSLTALQLDYVDLYLIHHPTGRITDKLTGESKQVDTDHVAIWKVNVFFFVT